MDNPTLLKDVYTWTTARIAAVNADDLDAPTPCSLWSLRELLDHTVGSLTMLTDAVAPDAAPTASDGESTSWEQAVAALAVRSQQAWEAPGVMDRAMEVPPMGTMPAAMLAGATLLETVTHGWDISQASRECADIPDALALPVLAFARQALVDNRGDNFAADLGIGDTPSDQLIAFLGRKPL
jgi:uncharacterized protein (TIGR03086 family)